MIGHSLEVSNFNRLFHQTQAPITPNHLFDSSREIVGDYVEKYIDVGPPLCTVLQSEMLKDGARSG